MASARCAQAISRARARAAATRANTLSSRASNTRQHVLPEGDRPEQFVLIAGTAMSEIISAPSAISGHVD